MVDNEAAALAWQEAKDKRNLAVAENTRNRLIVSVDDEAAKQPDQAKKLLKELKINPEEVDEVIVVIGGINIPEGPTKQFLQHAFPKMIRAIASDGRTVAVISGAASPGVSGETAESTFPVLPSVDDVLSGKDGSEKKVGKVLNIGFGPEKYLAHNPDKVKRLTQPDKTYASQEVARNEKPFDAARGLTHFVAISDDGEFYGDDQRDWSEINDQLLMNFAKEVSNDKKKDVFVMNGGEGTWSEVKTALGDQTMELVLFAQTGRLAEFLSEVLQTPNLTEMMETYQVQDRVLAQARGDTSSTLSGDEKMKQTVLADMVTQGWLVDGLLTQDFKSRFKVTYQNDEGKLLIQDFQTPATQPAAASTMDVIDSSTAQKAAIAA